jgi:hypothetical protein
MSALTELAQEWLRYKKEEADAVSARRAIEDEMARLLRVNQAEEGQTTFNEDNLSIKVNCRMTRKVDAEALQELALESGIGHDTLSALFRWKPELNMKEWKAAAPEITGALAGAITTTAGRPSFAIEQEQ